MMTCTKTRNSTRLPSITGTVRLVQKIGTVGPAEERTGEIAINGKGYFCRCLSHGYALVTLDPRSNAVKTYNLPADLSTCECLDFLSRGPRRTDGKCKHMKALGALCAAGKVPTLETDPIAHTEWDDQNNIGTDAA